MVWLPHERDKLNGDLEGMEFSAAVQSLEKFENDIQAGLDHFFQNEKNEENKHAYRRSLVCELAVDYKKTAMTYLNNKDGDLYI